MRKAIIATFVAAVIVGALTFGFPATRAQKKIRKDPRVEPLPQFVPGRVLVKFRSSVGLDHARQVIAGLGARDADTIPGLGVHILDLPFQSDESAFVQAFRGSSEVEFAERDRIVEPADINPNDPFFTSEGQLPVIGAGGAWTMTTGSPNVIIAILDTGVEATHPDLAPDLIPGWNTFDNNSNTSPVIDHGTTTAGTAGAASNNGIGLASICWSCKIMPMRVCDSNGWGSYSAIATALTWASDHGARVANISYMVTTSATVTSAAQYFQSRGGVVTSSAGNYSTFDSSPDNPYILTVSATDWNDTIYGFSNTGNNIDLAAPGYVFTTFTGGGYGYAAGTSYSAPVVAGVAGLVISANPRLTGAQVRDILKQSADDLGPVGWDSTYGWGRVNANRAVTMAIGGGSTTDTTPPSVNFNSPSSGATVSGPVSISVGASDNVGVSTVSLSIDGGSFATDAAAPYNFSWDTSAAANGIHSLSATATDAAGNATTTSITVSVNNAVDSIAPVVIITSPVNGGTVSGMVSITVNATDAVGVIKVESYVDGVLNAVSTSAPFTTKWNSRKASRGPHLIQAKAYDRAGNVGVSTVCQVSR
ncbi:MAG TPA: S8 family serine peptidase [Pyrinomonadaceae bacterium]